jgi:hypothetical protein
VRSFIGLLALWCMACAYSDAALPRDLDRLQEICSAWDVHITTQIEDLGRLGVMPNDDLALASFQQIQARVLCAIGRPERAFSIYEHIDLPSCEYENCSQINK